MYSIVVVTYNSENVIGNCLQSIKDHSKDAEVIVVDNSGKNYGMDIAVNDKGSYPSGLNQGLASANEKYLVCCNADIIVSPNWLDKLKWAINRGYGLVGPCSNYVSGVQSLSMPEQVNVLDVSFFIGFCFMMHRDTFNEVGRFDEQFLFEQDDIDYSIRCSQAGIQMGVMPHCMVQHVGHQSAITTDVLKTERFDSLYKLFMKYPEMDFRGYLGASWPIEWLNVVRSRHPDVMSVRSFNDLYRG